MDEEEKGEKLKEQRAEEIQIRLPRSTLEIKQLFSLLNSAFNRLNGNESGISFGSSSDLKPSVRLVTTNSHVPEISFQTPDKTLRLWHIGNLPVGFNLTEKVLPEMPATTQPTVEMKKDRAGEHYVIRRQSGIFYQLSFSQLLARFTEHITSVDHFGICLGPKLLDRTSYENFRSLVGQATNLYKYPTGQEWPFVVPATFDEYFGGIVRTNITRNPKFEIVYHPYHSFPELQIDLQTDLSREELEKLLPEPYGVSFPELANVFRTVYLYTGWLFGPIIRADLRFTNDSSDWTDWLIKNGKRIQ